MAQKKELVSIIVPVYNVSEFLEKCIESMIKQTYKNIEIILVDDGSTDCSGTICDEYKKKDKRVVVIHKKNSGVSSARNTGIEKATGEWITFVDADDYISSDFIEYMLSLVKKENSFFGLSKNCYLSLNDIQYDKSIEIMTPEEGTALLLSQKVIVGCWNKIYNRKFLIENNIKFSTDLFYGEGLEFITNVAQKTNSVAVGKKRVYFYRKNNENSATTKFNIEKYYNGEKSINTISKNMSINSELINKQLKIHYTLFCLNSIEDLISTNVKSKFISDYNRWHKTIKINKKELLKYKEVTNKEKVKILLAVYFPKLLVALRNIQRKKLYENSV